MSREHGRALVAEGLVLLIAAIAAVYLAAAAYLFFAQRSYVFHPDGALAQPAERGLSRIEVVTLKMKDGTDLTAGTAKRSPDSPPCSTSTAMPATSPAGGNASEQSRPQVMASSR
jgi:hypothetical protein